MLEESFKFRPVCLRNMRISSTLLKKGTQAGLTLAQIGQILCRPDDDDTEPSILETIVHRSRHVADHKATYNNKVKDSSLRLILPQPAAFKERRLSGLNVLGFDGIDSQSKSPVRKRGYSDTDDLNI